MSSEPLQPAPPRAGRTGRAAGNAVRGLAWGALLAVLAASGAGLAGLAWHPPGSPARAELTYDGDAALGARLDAATADLRQIAADVEELASTAKSALADVASADAARIEASLAAGSTLAAGIEARSRALREALADLPGAEPDAAMRYSNAVIARRAAVLAAVEAATGLAGSWQTVAARAGETTRLTGLISRHDGTVLAGIQHGLNSDFKKAVATIDDALAVMGDIKALRDRLLAPGETVLDEWMQRTQAYDLALQHLYAALVKAKCTAKRCDVTVEIQSARREEREAYAQLPPDRRTILVIVSEVSRNGLTQAVLAIDDARGRLDDALAAVTSLPDAAPGASPGVSPGASPSAPPGS